MQHQTALSQSQEAIETMGKVLERVGAVMRNDVGLVGWRQRRSVSSCREQLATLEVRCQIDDDRPPDLYTILRDWRVLSVTGGDEIPPSLDGYRVNEFSVGREVSNGLAPQACAVKYRDNPWQLGVSRTLPEPVAVEIFQDAIRLITGHIHGFSVKHDPRPIQPQAPDGSKGVAFLWSGVAADT
jgi:hypothetical protein